MKFISDSGIVFDKMEDCQAFEADPSFLMYDVNGHITNKGDNAMIIEIKTHEGFLFCRELMERQNSPICGLDDESGFYFWNAGRFHYLDRVTFAIIRDIKK